MNGTVCRQGFAALYRCADRICQGFSILSMAPVGPPLPIVSETCCGVVQLSRSLPWKVCLVPPAPTMFTPLAWTCWPSWCSVLPLLLCGLAVKACPHHSHCAHQSLVSQLCLRSAYSLMYLPLPPGLDCDSCWFHFDVCGIPVLLYLFGADAFKFL